MTTFESQVLILLKRIAEALEKEGDDYGLPEMIIEMKKYTIWLNERIALLENDKQLLNG